MLFPLTRAKLSSIARLRRRSEKQKINQNRTIESQNEIVNVWHLLKYLLMETSRSFRQSTMVLRCLWTALWSVCTVFSKDVSATYLKREGKTYFLTFIMHEKVTHDTVGLHSRLPGQVKYITKSNAHKQPKLNMEYSLILHRHNPFHNPSDNV